MSLAPSPREQQRLERHEEIVAFALATVSEHGIDALSMNKLARSVGFTPGALYRYFDSKDALIAEIAVRVIDDIHHRLDEQVDVSEADGELAYVIAVCEAYARFAAASPGAFGFISVLLSDPRVLVENADRAAGVAERLFALLSPLVSALHQAQVDGALAPGDATTRALSLFVSLHGALSLRKQQRHSFFPVDVDALRRDLVPTLLRGWGALDVSLAASGGPL